ncbi:unnamed protein product [Xylocopa violacea]|uniref:Uncharacterized protein n=1 Tax=Xylocopa violacea TaxID=135666 RepID=A0ABP1P8H8_XYLVO
MKNWSGVAPRLASAFFVVITVQTLVTVSECETVNDRLEKYVPDQWRTIPRGYQPPQIEIQLLKSHVSPDKNIVSTIEYIFSNGDYAKPVERESAEEKAKESNRNGKKIDNLSLHPKSIFDAVKKFNPCPSGQAMDPLGKCRDIFQKK